MVIIDFFGQKIPLLSCYDNIRTDVYHYFGYGFIIEAQLIYFVQIVYTNIFI